MCDSVVFVQLGYRNFWSGVVSKITPKTLLIDHDKDNVGRTQTKQAFHQVVVTK